MGIPAILLMVIICAVGMDWESKAQNFLVTTIFAAILVYIIGTLIGPTSDQERAEGFVGFSCKFCLVPSLKLRHSRNIHNEIKIIL